MSYIARQFFAAGICLTHARKSCAECMGIVERAQAEADSAAFHATLERMAIELTSINAELAALHRKVAQLLGTDGGVSQQGCESCGAVDGLHGPGCPFFRRKHGT